ncbi:hypothetical protein Rcae01_05916 [Novipirellula caenicola]|uniref:Uncharacterized protein n=1 Tax=Novipirellula caenicola TaxID=1536901 RepID=A0ABP9W1Q4_9BACT
MAVLSQVGFETKLATSLPLGFFYGSQILY